MKSQKANIQSSNVATVFHIQNQLQEDRFLFHSNEHLRKKARLWGQRQGIPGEQTSHST